MVACVCGATTDDGERMLECEQCKVWQHVACVDAAAAAAKVFLCTTCASAGAPADAARSPGGCAATATGGDADACGDAAAQADAPKADAKGAGGVGDGEDVAPEAGEGADATPAKRRAKVNAEQVRAALHATLSLINSWFVLLTGLSWQHWQPSKLNK